MPTDLALRIVRWHPIVLTTLFVTGALAQVAFAETTPPPLVRAILMLIPVGLICVWLWAIYRVASLASATPPRRGWDWIYVVPPIIAVVTGLAGGSLNNTPSAFAMFVSLFVGLSRAAKTLENVSDKNGSAPIGQMLLTALLMYVAPLGVWVLRSKILRVADCANHASA